MLKREGKLKSARGLPLAYGVENSRTHPHKKNRDKKVKKMNEKLKKSWNEVVKTQKEMGFRAIHRKWIMGGLMTKKQNDERKGKKLVWEPHFMRMKVTEPK